MVRHLSPDEQEFVSEEEDTQPTPAKRPVRRLKVIPLSLTFIYYKYIVLYQNLPQPSQLEL